MVNDAHSGDGGPTMPSGAPWSPLHPYSHSAVAAPSSSPPAVLAGRTPFFPSAARDSSSGPILAAALRALPDQPKDLAVADPKLVAIPLAAYDPSSTFLASDSDVDGTPLLAPEAERDSYLFPRLTKNERDRLTTLWYYTRDIQEDKAFLAHLQDTIDLVQDLVPHDCVILGLVDRDRFSRLVTSNLPLAMLPRREATCAHTINQPEGSVMTLTDMAADARFAGSPAVAGGGLRSYVGAQLEYALPGGQGTVSLGSLCAASFAPRPALLPTQERALVRVAEMIVRDVIERARSRRRAVQRSMAGRLAELSERAKAGDEVDIVLGALHETYPDATVALQDRPDDTITLTGAEPVSYTAFADGLYEDVVQIEHDLLRFNHLPEVPHASGRTLRAIAIRSQDNPHQYLVVQTGTLEHIFDDVDAAFVHGCALVLCTAQQASALAQAAVARARFLRGMAHELRTPIHALLSTCELLAEDSRGRAGALVADPFQDTRARTAEHAALLATTIASGRALLGTVNNLLNFDRLESFAPVPTFAALASTEQAILDTATAAAAERHASVRIACEHTLPPDVQLLYTDHDLLRQCLSALLANAVRFTATGTITLRTSLDPPDSFERGEALAALVYDVTDTGCGIAAADTARIFRPWEHGGLGAGAGLGLPVAAAIARALGGAVSLVDSSPGGSHFRLRLEAPTFACQLGHPSRRLARAALPMTFAAGPASSPALAEAARALAHVGFAFAEPGVAALVLLAAPSPDAPAAAAFDAALAAVLPRQLVLCLHATEEEAQAAQQAAAARGLEERVLCVLAPFHQARLWDVLEEVMDAFDRLALALLWTVPTTPTLHRERSAPPCAPVRRRRTALRILAVDDNKTNLDILRLYCRRRQHACDGAIDGQQAVERFCAAAAADCPVSLVLMDLQMPIMDGIEAVRNIRASEVERRMPSSLIYMVSGQSVDADKRRALAAGADGYFVKPLSLRTLDDLIALHFPVPAP